MREWVCRSRPAVYAVPATQSVDEGGGLAKWASRPAPRIALLYWRLPEGSTLRDVLLSVRADEVRGDVRCSGAGRTACATPAHGPALSDCAARSCMLHERRTARRCLQSCLACSMTAELPLSVSGSASLLTLLPLPR